MKIVFFGTSNVALPILEKLNKNHQVLAVVTNPDAPAGRSKVPQETPVSALARDLKLTTFKPESVKGNQEFIDQLKQLCLHPHLPLDASGHPLPGGEEGGTGGADVFVVVSYGTIMPEEVINLPPLKSVNVHFAPLPKYRGPSPIQAALLNGDTQTGTSIFILDEKVDHGPLLSQKIVDIEPSDNFFTLADRLAKISADLLLETLADYQAGKLTPLPQDESRASYCKIITKDDGRVDWQKSSTEIYNQFRAFYIWPGIWTMLNGKKIKITDCVVIHRINESDESTNDYECGTVITDGKVVCGGGTILQIKSLKPEGKNEMAIADFLNGSRDFIGTTLI